MRPLQLGGGLSLALPLAEAAAAPIAPLIGPAQELRIDGQPISATTRAQDSPTLSWTPPAHGTAAGYGIGILLLYADQSGGATLSEIAEFITIEPRVQVPPGILMGGQTYAVAVRAIAGAMDLRGAPNRFAGAHGQSVVLSDPFTR